MACGCMTPTSASIFLWFSPLWCLSQKYLSLFCPLEHLLLGLELTLNSGSSHLMVLNLMISAKNLFPEKIPFTRFQGLGCRCIFLMRHYSTHYVEMCLFCSRVYLKSYVTLRLLQTVYAIETHTHTHTENTHIHTHSPCTLKPGVDNLWVTVFPSQEDAAYPNPLLQTVQQPRLSKCLKSPLVETSS